MAGSSFVMVKLIGQDLVGLIARHNQIARAIARGEQP